MGIALWSVLGVVGIAAVGLYLRGNFHQEDAKFWRGMYKAEVEYQEEEANAA